MVLTAVEGGRLAIDIPGRFPFELPLWFPAIDGRPGAAPVRARMTKRRIAQTAQPQKSAAVMTVITKKRNRMSNQSMFSKRPASGAAKGCYALLSCGVRVSPQKIQY